MKNIFVCFSEEQFSPNFFFTFQYLFCCSDIYITLEEYMQSMNECKIQLWKAGNNLKWILLLNPIYVPDFQCSSEGNTDLMGCMQIYLG